ncbi:Uncharacterised protein [Mycobacteroides abscessus subsp. abscessus]|uniref:hypothetical protein n=1 Tax=Mycobacteroides abscessus TaxID=36809 RepID=UPI000928727C|nr:hypothetical protein [Mycobacteroides abscessus]SIC55706.1 Uncharacterised protein [Mycobacteroides abscessus subsp. abscessus]SKU58170.1 Uncharacterised protein [Mycobacteroides abscessus subsp. abscessus]
MDNPVADAIAEIFPRRKRKAPFRIHRSVTAGWVICEQTPNRCTPLRVTETGAEAIAIFARGRG